ncbi:hypothetical protein XOCgx_2567 [Xanthomonas oryzae pv. oryzicola]|nr:hypothetical protein XOCgx_2567 [Xanthomonas oryzae pv. oryzicola]
MISREDNVRVPQGQVEFSSGTDAVSCGFAESVSASARDEARQCFDEIIGLDHSW